jgi:hypothetical protein
VRRYLEKLLLPAVLVAICAWLAFEKSSVGEYTTDAGTAVEALIHGNLSLYFSWHPVLGPLATLFEAPFALLGHDVVSRFQWACFGCLLVAAAVGWYLGTVAERRGAGLLTRIAVPVLFVLNPLTLAALSIGHPEEMMTAALAIAAVLLAAEGRTWQGAVLLGLAIATKQWAALAIFPVLMAMPGRRVRSATIAGSVVVALNLPYAIANLGALSTTQQAIVGGSRISSIWSAWFPVSPLTERRLPNIGSSTMVHELPAFIQPWTHYLIGATALLIPLGIWALRGRFDLDPERAIALFCLLALLRCALDPNDNVYYHVPLLAGLIAWDVVSPDRLPKRALVGTAVAYLFREWSERLGSLALFNAAYIAVMLGAGLAIAYVLLRREGREPAVERSRAGAAVAARA